MSSVNNKLIAKNTIVLYFRMIIIMGINLYVVRAVLNILGVVDYGIYNVIGGVVGMFSFISGTLASSSQRYFSIELARKDYDKLRQWFSLNITIFLVVIFIFIVIAETLGLWFLNSQLIIPVERLYATNILYQLSIFTLVFQMLKIPYDALVIAHEKMNVYAYISIFEAVLKLAIVFILSISIFDDLVMYGSLILFSAIIIFIIYMFYCNRNFKESRFRFYWNKKQAIELLGFSGWHFLGTISMVIRGNGINILINMFFNPAVNAARAIAFQVTNAVNQLSSNFFTAVKPQIYKSHSSGQVEEMNKLVIRTTIMSFFLVSLLIFPIIINIEFVLDIWLKNIPEYAVLFTKLVLINGLVDAANGPSIAAALATGRIKRFQIIVSVFFILNLPFSYLALSLGYEPQITMLISIFLSVILVFVRFYLLKNLVNFPYRKMYLSLFRVAAISVINYFILYSVKMQFEDSFILFIVIFIISTALLVVSYYFFILDKSERAQLNFIVKDKLFNEKNK